MVGADATPFPGWLAGAAAQSLPKDVPALIANQNAHVVSSRAFESLKNKATGRMRKPAHPQVLER
jgi:hypothetical protein